jgi:hypothetical protein
MDAIYDGSGVSVADKGEGTAAELRPVRRRLHLDCCHPALELRTVVSASQFSGWVKHICKPLHLFYRAG